MTAIIEHTSVQAPDWTERDLPATPGTVIQYRNAHGSRVVAALSDNSMWRVLCINIYHHVHQLTWTPARLADDLYLATSFHIIPAE